jgi:hypothetical protein
MDERDDTELMNFVAVLCASAGILASGLTPNRRTCHGQSKESSKEEEEGSKEEVGIKSSDVPVPAKAGTVVSGVHESEVAGSDGQLKVVDTARAADLRADQIPTFLSTMPVRRVRRVH